MKSNSTIIRRFATTVSAGLLAVGAMTAMASPASAETNPHCPSGVTQMGATAYITHGGTNIGSVKQFKGCGKNWAYTFVWEGFRSSHSNWEVCVSIASGSGPRYDLEDLQCHSKKSANWSSGANTLNVCTHAVGNIKWGGNTPTARTKIDC